MQSDHLRRRDFIALVGGAAAAWPVSARAQQQPVRIGFLGSTSAARFGSRIEAFRSGLRDFGYLEGKTIVIAFRWADEKYDQLPALAAELVRENVDVIVTHGTPGTLAAKHATTAIPIVVLYIGDAVATGVVASLRQPGGNVTGSSYFLPQLMSKRLELLKEAMPHITKAAVLVKPDNPLFALTLPALEAAGSLMNIGLQRFDAHGPNDFEPAFRAMAKAGGRCGRDSGRRNISQQRASDRRSCLEAIAPLGGIERDRRSRRPDRVRCGSTRDVPSRGGVRRQGPQGHQSPRPPCRAGRQVRNRSQHACRKDARRHDTTSVLLRADRVIE
jgi:hypothetical protein